MGKSLWHFVHMTELPRYKYMELADAIEVDIASGKLAQGVDCPVSAP